MPAPEDDRSLSAEEIKAATISGHLPALAERLARERAWFALTSLFEQTSALPLSVPLLTETVRRCTVALRTSPDRRRDRAGAVEDIRVVRLLAGETLAARVVGPALTHVDRAALAAAAAALADGGDLQRAATTFEQASDWTAAAEVWGRLGELEQMEACLARDEETRRSHQAARGAVRDIEALAAAGERVAALRVAESVPEGLIESARVRQIVLGLGARLVRSRAVTLRLGDDRARAVRVAATPAVLGRDPTAEITLRDPGVSRRHALIAVVGDEVSLTDAGSRSGTFVGGARLGTAFPLRGPCEVALGASCRLDFQLPAAGRVLARGQSGLDRGLLALIGNGSLSLEGLLPEAAGICLDFDGTGVSLLRPPELPIRIAGVLVSTRIELLHGDVLEVGPARLRLEIE
jgi:hypothetical protein